jgi:hypothetical protein
LVFVTDSINHVRALPTTNEDQLGSRPRLDRLPADRLHRLAFHRARRVPSIMAPIWLRATFPTPAVISSGVALVGTPAVGERALVKAGVRSTRGAATGADLAWPTNRITVVTRRVAARSAWASSCSGPDLVTIVAGERLAGWWKDAK